MKQLVIIGAGGMGRTMCDLVKESHGYETEFIIKGFIDDNNAALSGFVGYPPILGNIYDYTPKTNDVFVCSMGGDAKIKCVNILKEKGGKFINIIHKTARIGTGVILGDGNIIAAYSSIGANAVVGNNNLIQSYAVIGHDAHIGDFNRIDTHVTCVGGVAIGNNVIVFTSAVVSHNVKVEDNARIGALSFVIRNVKMGCTVVGNPAKKLMI